MVRKLSKEEYGQATTLALDVYCLCGFEDFNAEGLATFKNFINSKELADELVMYGAFEDDLLIGILGIKNNGTHVTLFFVRKEYHRKGIGKKLFDFAIQDCPVEEMSVNSSSYAISFYESLGFEKTAEKQEKCGITSTPMKKVFKQQHIQL